MKFPYQREPARPSTAFPERAVQLRPRIPIRIRYGVQFYDVLALIDSGADTCVFPAELARALSIELNSDRMDTLRGIGGGSLRCWFRAVQVEVGGHPMTIDAAFADDANTVPLLGQHSFFDQFTVIFKKRKSTVELRPVDEK